METKGAPIGNQNARKAREWRDALIYVLDNFEDSAIEKGKALREIATQLVHDDRAEGYAEPSVRKILSGTYSAQKDRKIPGLAVWMRKRN